MRLPRECPRRGAEGGVEDRGTGGKHLLRALAPLGPGLVAPPAMSGIELANWNWKVVRRFVADWFGVRLCHSSSLNYPAGVWYTEQESPGSSCTGWDLLSSVPRNVCSRRMRPSARRSWPAWHRLAQALAAPGKALEPGLAAARTLA